MHIHTIFYNDNLSLIMSALIGFVVICVGAFSIQYLNGDKKQSNFFYYLTCLTISLLTMVNTDHLFVLFSSWLLSNIFLSRLMLHKSNWQAAKESYLLALRYMLLGSSFLGTALSILYIATKQTSIQLISTYEIPTHLLAFIIIFMTLAAMVQSALWPFHSWLTSSLNSPTPASAIMHAGLINGGGFLIARFAFLFSNNITALNILFLAGITTALIGTLWKLMQTDVKRMLACSTMGQMGFMIAQCGLGLFPAAVAHLCWHGLFKANLFLGSGSAAQEQHSEPNSLSSLPQLLIAIICGFIGGLSFAYATGRPFITSDTTLFLNIVAVISATQLALTLLHKLSILSLISASITTSIAGIIYGFSIRLIENLLPSLSAPHSINMLHVFALLILAASWLGMFIKFTHYPKWALKLFVIFLNASQPHNKTITTHRNDYKF